MANNYPNPCDTCKKCTNSGGCVPWKMRYRYRQKQINAFGKGLYQKKESTQKVWAYQHPDDARRYLADGPCKGCKAEPVCETPCPAYIRWWDARMTALKIELQNAAERSAVRNG